MSLAIVIHRIATNQSFANQFQQDPASALASAGLELNKLEMASLQKLVNRPDWQSLYCSAEAETDPSPWLPIPVVSPAQCSNT